MERSNAIRYFTNSVVVLLAMFATALFAGNAACLRLTQPRDPLLAISMDALLWILGLGALAVALVCVRSTKPRLQLALVGWFAANVVVYRVGLYWVGVPDIRGYVSSLAGVFNLSAGLAAGLLNGLFLYLFTVSAALLAWSTLGKAEEVALKAICARCGGHIAFSPRNLGRSVPCPHCQSSVTLRSPENLKMSCYFCKGHIEFPPHARGTKLKCPHCGMDITLKQS